MRLVRSMAIAVAFVFAGISAASAASISGGQVQDAAAVKSIITLVQNCETLRRACEQKDRLGVRGEGNCKRYRATCLRRRPNCNALRRACLYKGERGERGEGNCRRYRELCRR